MARKYCFMATTAKSEPAMKMEHKNNDDESEKPASVAQCVGEGVRMGDCLGSTRKTMSQIECTPPGCLNSEGMSMVFKLV
jgi:hypothetical protein